MSEWLLQVRYTGVGPRQNAWLNAADPGGFMVHDKHKTEGAARKELVRLTTRNRKFLSNTSDWEARVVSRTSLASGVAPSAPPSPAPKPKVLNQSPPAAVSDAPTTVLESSSKGAGTIAERPSFFSKKKKAKKKATKKAKKDA